MKFQIVTVAALAAKLLTADVSKDFTAFNPAYEGTYSIKLKCMPGETSAWCAKFPSQLKMTILNNFQKADIALLTTDEQVYWRFEGVSHNVSTNELWGNAFNTSVNHPAVEVGLEFDRQGEDVKVVGWIRDTQFKKDVKIEGSQTFTPYNYYSENENPNKLITPATLIGDYEGHRYGEGNQTEMLLRVRRSVSTGKLYATMLGKNERDNKKQINFLTTQMYPEFGVFGLSGLYDLSGKGNKNLEKMKMTLNVLESPSGAIMLNGVGAYTNDPGYHSMQFKKVK